MSNQLRERAWYVSEDGTRYVRDKARKKPPKEKMPDVSPHLEPFFKGEAEGDFQLAVLLAMRDLIRSPDRYIKTMRACNKSGQATEPEGSDARRWNIFGALMFFTHAVPRSVRTEIITHSIKPNLPEEFRVRLSEWEAHEDTTHFQVIRLISHAIETRKRVLKYIE